MPREWCLVRGVTLPPLGDSWETSADPQDPEFRRKQLLKIDEWMDPVASCSLCPSLTFCPSPLIPFLISLSLNAPPLVQDNINLIPKIMAHQINLIFFFYNKPIKISSLSVPSYSGSLKLGGSPEGLFGFR